MELHADRRRVSSAGYRLPAPRRPAGRAAPSPPPPPLGGGAVKNHRDPKEDFLGLSNKSDPIQQDQIWREYVQTEMRGVREWEKNWSFLKNYDPLGQPRAEAPLPSSVSVFSGQVPNTASQTLGSRESTPLGRELMRMDRLVLWTGSRRAKPDPEILPS